MSRIATLMLSLAKIAGVLAALGVLFVISGYYGVQMALSGDEIDVPDIVGAQLAAAEQELEEQGLAVVVEEERLPHASIPEGHVLRQNPPAGSSIKRQRSITLTLSSGPPQRAVPDTVGSVVTRAQIQLQQQEVGVEYRATVHSEELPEDRVIAQESDHAELEPGEVAPARLLVSLGPYPTYYVMPELYGRTLDEARQILEVRGFRLASPTSRQVRGFRPGIIVGQEPSPGFRVEAGATIKLTVTQ